MPVPHFLSQFELADLGPKIYRIGQYSPVSMRDEIVRAVLLVEHLFVAEVLKPGKTLAIIGAGAAGVTAAMRATEHGLVPILIERDDKALALQARCASRHLDPSQYDWPAAHWNCGAWPPQEKPAPPVVSAQHLRPPVSLQAGMADAVAADFENELGALRRAGKLRFLPHTRVDDFVPTSSGYSLKCTDARTGTSPAPIDVDVIVVAVGVGDEEVSLAAAGGASFSGLRFWDTDPFEQPACGLPSHSKGVLISGGGDGALQDFIRLATGKKSARDVWEATTRSFGDAEHRVFERLAHWEDSFHRTMAMSPRFRHRCELLSALDARYRQAVDSVFTGRLWIDAKAALDAVTSSRPAPELYLATKGEHIDSCYPLNRATTLVLFKFLREGPRGYEPHLPNTALRSVLNSPAANWGASVQVELARNVNCRMTREEIDAWHDSHGQTYDSIVIRHGIDPSALLKSPGRLRPQLSPPNLP